MSAFCFFSFSMSKMTLLWAGSWSRDFEVPSNPGYSMITMYLYPFPEYVEFRIILDVEGSADYVLHRASVYPFSLSPVPLPRASPLAWQITSVPSSAEPHSSSRGTESWPFSETISLIPNTAFSIIFYFLSNIFFCSVESEVANTETVIISEPDAKGDSITDNKQSVGTGLVNCLARHCSLTKHVWNV